MVNKVKIDVIDRYTITNEMILLTSRAHDIR
jgi:hypothetical protein